MPGLRVRRYLAGAKFLSLPGHHRDQRSWRGWQRERSRVEGSTGSYLFEFETHPGGPQGHSDTTAGSTPITVSELPRHGCPRSRFVSLSATLPPLRNRAVPSLEPQSRTPIEPRRNHVSRPLLKHARYDVSGNMTSEGSPTQTLATTRTYDNADRLTKITAPFGNGLTTTFGLDNMGRVTSITDAVGTVTTQEFDSRSRLTKTSKDADGYGPGAAGVVTNINNISYTFQHDASVLQGVKGALEKACLKAATDAIKPFEH